MNLRIEGEVELPGELSAADLAVRPEQIPDVSALVSGREGRAVWLRAVLLEDRRASPAARYATLGSRDGRFAISVPLGPLCERGLLVYGLGDGPLPPSQGGPMRVLLVDAPDRGSEGLDACAAVKDLGLIRLTREREADVGHAHR